MPAVLKADIALDLQPDRRLPTVHLELLGIILCFRHHARCVACFFRGRLLRIDVEQSCVDIPGFDQSVDRQGGVREDIVVDNIIEKDRIRVERVRPQNDALCEVLILTDDPAPDESATPDITEYTRCAL